MTGGGIAPDRAGWWEKHRGRAPSLGITAIVLVIAAIAPLIFSDYYLNQILTKALFFGIVAASLIFLAAYGGRVSLAQTALYGIAGFTMANLVVSEGGANLTWHPWAGVVVGLLGATMIGLFMGAISSRSTGIYFLMITLAFGVLTLLFFEKVNEISGFGGVNNVERPGLVGEPAQHPNPLYYISLVAAFGVYLLIRYIVRTPFGVALQGIRDEPTRMRALGFSVELHRTLAFGIGAFMAGIGGILFTWWNGNISPGAINFGVTIDVLVIAVIGGLFRLEGAWVGALLFVILDNETRGVDWIGGRFNTVIGSIFFVIVLLSPGGLLGIWETLRRLPARLRARGPSAAEQPGA